MGDAHAWSNFVDIYGPLLYRYARKHGLGDADSADLAQLVLIEVARCIGRFEYEARTGRFRTWLMRIARSKLSDVFRRKKRLVADGGSANLRILSEQPMPDSSENDWLFQYQEHLFYWAADRVRCEVEPATWQAFWKTAVENQPVSEVASELEMKVGTVYVAKSRVLSRIRDKISEVDESLIFQ